MMGRKPKTPAKNHQTLKPSEQPTFLDHLHELKRRFFMVAITLIVAGSVGYSLHEHLVRILLAPLHGEKLVYLTPGGGFDFIFKVSIYFGFLVTIPVLVFQLYRYVTPLMPATSRKFSLFMVLASFILATTGALFGYFVAVPAALQFLISFGGDYITANLTASSYLGFVTIYLLGLAALFQLPLILLLINQIGGPLKPSKLFSYEGHVFLGAFVLAALITPTPDVINQAIIAGPVIVIYQLGIIFVWVHNKMRKLPEKEVPKTFEPITPLPPVPQTPAVQRQIHHMPEVPIIASTQPVRQNPIPRPQPQTMRRSPVVRPVDSMVRPVRQPMHRPPTLRPQPRLARPPARPRPLQRPNLSIDGLSSW